ncbi:MAG: hypothetical protein WC529_03300 [Candidatus Margulisiibacteriota bacterium]
MRTANRIGRTDGKYAGVMANGAYRRNLELVRNNQLRLTARFVIALKDPAHPLGNLFAKKDLNNCPVLKEALAARAADKVAAALQAWLLESVFQMKIMTDQGLAEVIRGARRWTPPAITDDGWHQVAQKVREGYMRMTPKGKRAYTLNLARVLNTFPGELAEMAKQARTYKLVKHYQVVVKAGVGGRMELDLLTDLRAEETSRWPRL